MKPKYFLLKIFKKQKDIIHGFSGRKLGNMNSPKGDAWENIAKFLKFLKLNQKNLVLMEQVHQNKVLEVGKSEKGKVLAGTDGLVTNERGVILGIKVADCLPILFCEPKRRIIGVAHGGWKGILVGIVPRVLEKMVDLGAESTDTLVGIGPHIGRCCYTILANRAQSFLKEFGDLSGMISQENGKLHLDLSVPVIYQLEKMGIKWKNIEVIPDCTYCQNKKFFSFRKEGNKHGSMLGVISLSE